MDSFEVTPGFCPICGSILSRLKRFEKVSCYTCKNEYPPEVFGKEEYEYEIIFNTYDPEKIYKSKITKKEKEEADGPIVERKCSKCGYGKMSYATVQLRSADEGQTVFFTCIKCNFKESENS